MGTGYQESGIRYQELLTITIQCELVFTEKSQYKGLRETGSVQGRLFES